LILNGALAGLVSITAGPDYPSMGLAIVIGVVGAGLAVIAIPMFDKARIDDPVGALSVHLVAGIWGTLAVGIFNPDVSFVAQLLGVSSIGAFVFFSSIAAWAILRALFGIRVSLEEETQGIDIVEFGQTAYTFDNYQQLRSEGVG